ncbi:MAG: hypothetical protein R3D33_07305 [Hyphomicrobiaceae bacterium]
MANPDAPAPVWKYVIASILDAFMVFFAGGYAIGWLTGNLTEEGFNLSGRPAIALIVLIIGYFFILNRYFGGTIWRRIFGIPGRRA